MAHNDYIYMHYKQLTTNEHNSLHTLLSDFHIKSDI